MMTTAFRIEFILYTDGRAEPDVLHSADGVFASLEDAVAQGNQLFGKLNEFRGSEGSESSNIARALSLIGFAATLLFRTHSRRSEIIYVLH
jgi:hypothetical protein